MTLLFFDFALFGMKSAVPVSEVITRGTDGRVRFPESFKVIGEKYGTTARGVRKWVEIGKKKDPEDIPPLHDPEQMLAWWQRCMKHETPAAIQSAALMKEAESPDESKAPSKKPEIELEAVDLSTIEPGTISETVAKIARLDALAAAHMEKEMAEERPNLTRIDYWQKVHSAFNGKLRAWEKDLPKMLKDRGELLSKKDLIPELVAMAGGIANNFDKTLGKLIRRFLPDITDDDLFDLVVEYRDPCFAELRETVFSNVMKEAVTDGSGESA